MQDWHGSKPTSLSGYLEAMIRSIFTAGISWKVVEAKFGGIREAFEGFDVETVAAMTPADIARLAGDTRVIRYFFLAMVDEPVPSMEECGRAHGGAHERAPA